MDLDFVCIECDIAVSPSVLVTAALYDGLRQFERYFKASCCSDLHKSCDSCGEFSGCPYRTVFGQMVSPDPEIVRCHQKPSLPFSLSINCLPDTYSSNTVGMTIVGTAVNYIGTFLDTLHRMISASLLTVVPQWAESSLRFYNIDYQGVRHEIGSRLSLSESVILLSGRHIMNNSIHSENATLVFTSPLRLISGGSLCRQFDFAHFFRSQLRRCSSLCAYYGSGEMELDFVALSHQSQAVVVLEDDMHYTQPSWTKLRNRAGLTGSIECAGLVDEMFSLLLLGSYFNAGKGAAFGLGCYTIKPL